jgi:hypothetical protein
VRDFYRAHWSDARNIAAALGHDVTPTEVLATAGMKRIMGI